MAKEEFEINLWRALVKVFVWSIGEVEPEKLERMGEEGWEDVYDAFGKLIFLVFLFLFVIVLMNLLNAVAIGDIQVMFLHQTRKDAFLYLFISYLKRLQDEAIGLRNRKKILDIIEQSPEVHNTYKFKDIFDAPKPHTTYRLFQWILDKVKIIGLA